VIGSSDGSAALAGTCPQQLAAAARERGCNRHAKANGFCTCIVLLLPYLTVHISHTRESDEQFLLMYMPDLTATAAAAAAAAAATLTCPALHTPTRQ
jgi:hypothetical protein